MILSVCDQDRDKLTAALSVLLSTTEIGESDYVIYFRTPTTWLKQFPT